jgi:uncharacterized membrane protein YjjP (DUF1212 family)
MGEEKTNYIKELETLLSQGNVSENIKKLISNLSNDTNNSNNNINTAFNNIDTNTQNNEHEKRSSNYDSKNSSPIENVDALFKVKNIIDMVNRKDDARISLIESLRPFLSSSRQKKIPECIKILQLINMGKIFSDNPLKKTGGENSES